MMLKNLILPIVVSVAAWLIQEHYRAAPAISLLVSDAMEISSPQGNTEYAQEISISNRGRAEAKAISVKIPRAVDSYKLTKHSSLAKDQTISEPSFELFYPELPSNQKIRLAVRYSGSAIPKESISASHSGGNAEPMDSPVTTANMSWVLLAFWLGIAFSIFLDIKRFKKEAFLKWSDTNDIFRDDKPWFVTASGWSQLQHDAIEKEISKHSWTESLSEDFSFQLLRRHKPALLSDEHWQDLQKQARKRIEKLLSDSVTGYTTKSKLLDLLKLERPHELPLQIWDKFQSSIQERLQTILLSHRRYDVGLIELLDSSGQALKDVPEELAVPVRREAQKQYHSMLLDQITRSRAQHSRILNDARLDLLTPEQAKEVRERTDILSRAVGLPSPLTDLSLRAFVDAGQPSWMDESEFACLATFSTQLSQLQADQQEVRAKQLESCSKELELQKQAAEVTTLRQLLTRQLEVIHQVLSDPNAIDRLEQHDGTFGPGNRKNLERVAAILKSASMA